MDARPQDFGLNPHAIHGQREISAAASVKPRVCPRGSTRRAGVTICVIVVFRSANVAPFAGRKATYGWHALVFVNMRSATSATFAKIDCNESSGCAAWSSSMNVVQGDLLQMALAGRFDVIIHGCNCLCAMGKGIALSIKQQFPEAYDADRRTERGARAKLGTISHADVERAARMSNSAC
jgi:hypothetical protein